MANVTFKAEVVWSGHKTRCLAKINQHELVIDEPAQLGGDDQGPNPVEILLASLGGCLNIVVAMLAPRYEVAIKGLKVELEGDLDPDGFMEKASVRTGFQEIRFKVAVESDAAPARVRALVEHARRICPVGDTLGGVPLVEIRG